MTDLTLDEAIADLRDCIEGRSSLKVAATMPFVLSDGSGTATTMETPRGLSRVDIMGGSDGSMLRHSYFRHVLAPGFRAQTEKEIRRELERLRCRVGKHPCP